MSHHHHHVAPLRARTKLKRSVYRALYPAVESIAKASQRTSRSAARFLFNAKWSVGDAPEWFDGRLSLLDPERWMTEVSPVAHANIVEKLPVDGALLDLCGGDGFLPYYLYSRRAKQVVSVDHDETAHRHAVRHHSKPNIRFVLADLFNYDPGSELYDVVAIRGAIEHFTPEQQQEIFRKANRALKPGGWFCGDTPANPDKGTVLLDHHQGEWADEDEMRAALSGVFSKVETKTFEHREASSPDTLRLSLLWRCQKTER